MRPPVLSDFSILDQLEFWEERNCSRVGGALLENSNNCFVFSCTELCRLTLCLVKVDEVESCHEEDAPC